MACYVEVVFPPSTRSSTAGSINNAAGHDSPFMSAQPLKDGEQPLDLSIQVARRGGAFCGEYRFVRSGDIAQAKAREHEGGAVEGKQIPPARRARRSVLYHSTVGNFLQPSPHPGKSTSPGSMNGWWTSVGAPSHQAKVGPFDLGTVVIREALRVNPETGEVFIDSAGSVPFPEIVDGIPNSPARHPDLTADRPEFVLNPTSCLSHDHGLHALGLRRQSFRQRNRNPTG